MSQQWVPIVLASPGGSLRSATRSNPGPFQIAASALGPRTCEILHMSFKSGAYLPHSPLALPKLNTTSLQSQTFWGLSCITESLGSGARCVAWTCHSLGRTSAIVLILIFVGSLPGVFIFSILCLHPSYPSCFYSFFMFLIVNLCH